MITRPRKLSPLRTMRPGGANHRTNLISSFRADQEIHSFLPPPRVLFSRAQSPFFSTSRLCSPLNTAEMDAIQALLQATAATTGVV